MTGATSLTKGLVQHSHSWRGLSVGAKLFISLIVMAGTAILAWGAIHQSSKNIAEFICYLGIAILASRLKVNLPGITGTLSVNFLFILIGVLELSFTETLILGSVSMLAQCLYPERPKALQVTFNVCAGAVSTALAYGVYHHPLAAVLLDSRALLLGVAATVYFISNAGAIAAVISMTERRPLTRILVDCYFWSFPYYLVGAGIAGAIAWFNENFNWETSLLLVPAVYLIYRSYRLYLGKLEDEKRHVEEMASLHLRTIEALALAIEAKDHTTHEHLQRVRIYAIEVAKELGVTGTDLEALHAAALLHDIGKLAVPEHIISKPGRLTPEEFEKMKIHTLVGAEILERVRFPYPVVPIVRAHHEKYDGSGYPLGLKGAEIPIGARILAAVDYLDALASDRQYRRALPLRDVMQKLVAESGKSFDPKVVEVLQRRYQDMEHLAVAKSLEDPTGPLSTAIKIERGLEPAAGFENITAPDYAGRETTFLSSIAAARQEAQSLFELSQDLGASLSLGETLSVFSVKLKPMVPYDAIAIYILREEELFPEFVNGDNYRLFSSLRIPFGQGLSGWVAQNRKPIINGNPSVEPGYLNDPSKFSTLRSALAVPLEGVSGTIGVLALYRAERDAFTSDHLRILLAVSSKMALAIENALKYQQAENSATTDYLTGLPNARSLFLQLDRELARCKRDKNTLTVMVSDMDGFKQVNDRFGHLEGNRVLRLFAQALKDTSREYDYVARMGGDEFVVIAPGLAADAAGKKSEQMRTLAKQAGAEVCGEEIVSLSVGRSVYPEDGEDAEHLLAEADRRMYLEKQKQLSYKDRRLHPRLKCRVTVEMQAEVGEAPVFANLTDISMGGCYLETSAILSPGSKIKLGFSMDDGSLAHEGVVVRLDPGSGVAVQFREVNREGRERMFKILEFVQKATAFYNNRYFENLLKR
ncbi:Diguanylate cyclase and metal dependent phosphohydrolase [Candidatus Sulfotelmatobacter kueseliae]|uniref:Diguanylate cyclase and metal dependent phosphohydrolase n=1 Tax=Candidatus Sulfotelmatobacter kueseliae TaxID=2042962 RepID=A0A2U3KB83_9BACT|nr:Diguanylate cyclase and metal dependent phosphohydrolase [Candidatus Sulfotelmatobacter kueseliae]